MKINNEVKLDFDDVLLVPHRSRAASRANVNVERSFKFYHSTQEWNGLPIIAANMDSTGTIAMAKYLEKINAITCLHKHYSKRQYIQALSEMNSNNCWYTMGIKDKLFADLFIIAEAIGFIPNICIDVANGYTDGFVEFCAGVRSNFGNRPIIMAGNVCTPEIVQELILHGGVDIVKIGIGPGSACTTRLKTGCFVGDSKINTINGLKQIKDINIGEKVLTHDGSYQAVTNVHNNGFKNNLVEINGFTCTDDHEFYVIDKVDQDKVTEENIHDFAYWLEAKDISEEKHFIIQIFD
jgi:hypothetical protein